MTKNYDFEKAKTLIEKHKSDIVSASLGMHEDWFWTAETVYEGGEYKKMLPANEYANQKYDEYIGKRKSGMSLLSDERLSYSDIMVAGIYGSDWATPTLQLSFKDGTEKMIPCYLVNGGEPEFQERVSEVASKQAMLLGPLSGPVQDNITPLTAD